MHECMILSCLGNRQRAVLRPGRAHVAQSRLDFSPDPGKPHIHNARRAPKQAQSGKSADDAAEIEDQVDGPLRTSSLHQGPCSARLQQSFAMNTFALFHTGRIFDKTQGSGGGDLTEFNYFSAPDFLFTYRVGRPESRCFKGIGYHPGLHS